MAKAKSNKSKAARKSTHWDVVIFSVIGTLLVLVIVGAIVSMPSGMRYKHRKDAFKQLNLENKGFHPHGICKITARPDSKGGDVTRPAAHCSFVYSATVSETADKIKSTMKDAGWTFKRDAYPDSASPELHFKNDKGNFLIVSLSSKPRDDAFYNANAMNQDITEAADMDMDAGPTEVIVALNLKHDQW